MHTHACPICELDFPCPGTEYCPGESRELECTGCAEDGERFVGVTSEDYD